MERGDSNILERLYGQMENFRKKLIDFSGRNPLINFSHREESRKHIRIADEMPDPLYERLINGDRLNFNALPSLSKKKSSNEPQFGLFGSSVEPNSSQKTFPNKKDVLQAAIEKYQDQHNAALSYDLPEVGKAALAARHTDSYIQTRFLSEDMQKKLGYIRAEAKSSLEERGINTLYMAFGFLEWRDSFGSTAYHSPLILLPIDIDRIKIKGGYRYFIRAPGNSMEVNLSLSKRLASRFDDIAGLPEWGESSTPEEYFKTVNDGLCEGREGWQVKRWITIGHFNFARLVMYEDLAKENWPPSLLEGKDALQDILAGDSGNHDGKYADPYEIDTPEMDVAVPVLIADADHSQHSAVRDAMEGRSFVIEGPPGTGKSQTITNIIASLLMKDKKVLFVAEKAVAIAVVQKRLREAGLDKFSLELHAGNITEDKFHTALEERYKLYAETHKPVNLSSVQKQVNRDKEFLNDYGKMITSSYGQSGQKVHEIFWTYVQHAEDAEKEEEQKFLPVRNVREIQHKDIEETQRALNKFQKVFQEIVEKFGSLESHPWFGIKEPPNSPFETEEQIDTLRKRICAIVDNLSQKRKDKPLLGKIARFVVAPRAEGLLRWLKPIYATLLEFSEKWSVDLDEFFCGGDEEGDWRRISLRDISERIKILAEREQDSDRQWQAYIEAEERIIEKEKKTEDLQQFRTLLTQKDMLDNVQIGEIYVRSVYREMVKEIYKKYPDLGKKYTSTKLQGVWDSYKENDKEYIALQRKKLFEHLINKQVSLDSIKRELRKKSRHRLPIRQFLIRAGGAVQSFMPCFMMSPLTVAQFLKPGSMEFDTLIIDEASQMPPGDALGAVLRVKQVIIVGDQKQLPPSNFFQADEQLDEDEGEEEENVTHVESVLDIGIQSWSRPRRLLWHYRSRRGDLIDFSNKEFYEESLISFPFIDDRKGVSLHYIEKGRYQGHVNILEMQKICEAACLFMKENPDKSLGLVTMNYKQYNQIREEMDRLADKHQYVEEYLKRWEGTTEPFLTRNLESVQGDERDAIFISTLYGPNAEGRVMQYFGPINKEGGERRLNVLFTRAKHEVRVFTSMRPHHIQNSEKKSQGVRVFRNYLEFAATGKMEGPGYSLDTRDTYESPFEEAVGERLKSWGYTVVPQIGSSGYRIDLGVENPDKPGSYVLGIECDGAAYHSSASARDRDRLRQEQLESRGWKIHRIWGPDWWRNPGGEMENLVEKIERLRGDDES